MTKVFRSDSFEIFRPPILFIVCEFASLEEQIKNFGARVNCVVAMNLLNWQRIVGLNIHFSYVTLEILRHCHDFNDIAHA